jgi:branched-chain amino acid transport system ATP-binding protein
MIAPEPILAKDEAHGQTALEIDGLRSGYGDTTILHDISLKVPVGAVTGILGANGAGKTTLLRTISGLLQPTAGSVRFYNEDITSVSPHIRANRGLCHIPEGRGIFRNLTVRENLRLYCPRGSEAQGLELAIKAFPKLGSRLDQIAGTLSGGEQQMVAIVRAYVQQPRLVLVDEASLGLAPTIVDSIFEFMEDLAKSGSALVIVDQFVTRVLAMATAVHVMYRGELVFSGHPDTLMQEDIFQRYLGARG